jgi:serine protease
MAYWGGKVQTTPHVYLVYFGWGQSGAFPASSPCAPETLDENGLTATLPCDPAGAGKRMADFVSQLGGTGWAGVQTQYYQVVNGTTTHITNPTAQLAGIWVDDTNPTSAQITYTDLALEAQRAAAHFNVDPATLVDDNFVIAQPQNFSDPQAAAQGYCAFHDYTQKNLEGGIYNSVEPGLVYTNLPYVVSQGAGCGANLVNAGAAGTLDGVTVALGHEIEESVTDPGAEDVLLDGTYLGAWYDVVDSDENGDKCAYVGDDQGATDPSGLAVPGGAGNIVGNRGGQFPVQSLWSNASAQGLGYCAGAGNDLPF